jgi:hypothetical protein
LKTLPKVVVNALNPSRTVDVSIETSGTAILPVLVNEILREIQFDVAMDGSSFDFHALETHVKQTCNHISISEAACRRFRDEVMTIQDYVISDTVHGADCSIISPERLNHQDIQVCVSIALKEKNGVADDDISIKHVLCEHIRSTLHVFHLTLDHHHHIREGHPKSSFVAQTWITRGNTSLSSIASMNFAYFSAHIEHPRPQAHVGRTFFVDWRGNKHIRHACLFLNHTTLYGCGDAKDRLYVHDVPAGPLTIHIGLGETVLSAPVPLQVQNDDVIQIAFVTASDDV